MSEENTGMSNAMKAVIALVFTVVMVTAVVLLYMAFPGGGRTQEIRKELNDIVKEFTELSVRAKQEFDAQRETGNVPPRVILKVIDEDGASRNRVVKMHYRGYPWFEDSSAGCSKLWRAMLGRDLIVGNSSVKTYFYNDREMPRGGKSDACRYVVKTGDGFDYFVANGSVERL